MTRRLKKELESNLEKSKKTVDLIAGKDPPTDAVSTLSTADKDPWLGLTERQRQVQRLKLRGVSQAVIAKVLGVAQPTISRELAEIREVHRSKGIAIDKEAFIGESVSVYEEVEHKAWEMYMGLPDDSPIKIQALQLVMAAREKQTKVLVDIGLIEKASQRVEHTFKVTNPTLIDSWDQEGKARLAETVLSSQLKSLPEPSPPADIEDAEIE